MKSELFLLLVSLHTFSIFWKGKAYSLPYESTGGECKDSLTEYNPPGSNLCCSKCKPGNHLVSVCSGGHDTICGNCSKGTYSDSMSYHTNCFGCLACANRKGLMYSKNCSSVSNSECQCKPGLFCSMRQNNRCTECKPPKTCLPGRGVKPGFIQCVPCPEGTFSNETSTRPCQPHTKCEERGMVMLDPGNSEKDTTCGPLLIHPVTTTHDPQIQTTPRVFSTSDPTTTSSPSTFKLTETPRTTSHTNEVLPNGDSIIWIVLGAVIAIFILLVLLMACVFVMCHRKGLPKPPITETEPGRGLEAAFHYSKTEYQHLLDGKIDPSTSSSVSDSNSQSTGSSQDSIHTEQPVVSSPCVNVNITATFNVNPSTGSCSIPIGTLAQPQPVQPDLPLSQEEQPPVSCEEENSKEALQSVQERGMTVFKA